MKKSVYELYTETRPEVLMMVARDQRSKELSRLLVIAVKGITSFVRSAFKTAKPVAQSKKLTPANNNKKEDRYMAA